ncbi:hypothetical protein AAC387_Pa05g2327 [Persea americana]
MILGGMGRLLPKGKHDSPFTQSEIEQMEKLFQEAKDESLNEEFYQKLAKKLNLASGRIRKTAIEWTQVQRWFQSKHDACIAEASSSPSVSKELSVPPDACLSNSAPESSSDMPKVEKAPDRPELEFEARSSKDGAWYDVAAFLTRRVLSSGEPEVRVRFVGFGAEEDEWVNTKKAVRERSLPLDPAECRKVREGDLVLCFRERRDEARYFDAHVLEVKRRLHDIRGCRCLFLVRYDHDLVKERVNLRRICCRPSY